MSYETNKLECNDCQASIPRVFGMSLTNGNQVAMQSTYIRSKLSIEQEKNNKKNGKIQQRRRRGTKAHIWDDIK